MKLITRSIRYILSIFNIDAPIQLAYESALVDLGWFKSYETKKAVDKNGAPIPWYSYSFIAFIEERLSSDQSLFEYGSGHSTLWFSNRVKQVTAVESDQSWFEIVNKSLSKNATLLYRDLSKGQEYEAAVQESAENYDIIIVDGSKRMECIEQALTKLTDRGVLILDDSNRPSYTPGIDLVLSKGFKKIDFFGMQPVTPIMGCTTVFYKPNNCLSI